MARVKTTTRILIMSDLHAPYQDEKALKVVEAFKKDFKPQITVALGDWIDATSFSTHAKDVEDFDQLDEYVEGNILLDRFNPTHWIDGNHEHRLFRPGNIPQSYRRLLDHRKWLSFKDRGIKYFPYSSHDKDILRFGQLTLIHGFNASQYAVMRAALRYGSVVMGHTHRLMTAQPPHVTHKHTGFNIGCLCVLDQKYTQTWDAQAWSHGFAWGYLYKNGGFTLNVARLIGDEIHLEGKSYKI